LIKLLQYHCIFRYDTHAAQQPSSLLWGHAVVSLQFPRIHSFAWPNLGAMFFSGVGVYCVTISRQQIFKGLLQVTIKGVSPLVACEHWCHA